jgi:hypothetical protein
MRDKVMPIKVLWRDNTMSTVQEWLFLIEYLTLKG